MNLIAVIALLLIAVTFIALRYRETSSSFREGGLYSIEMGDGRFGVAKVLVAEPSVIHVRTYAQRFATRPTKVDERSLTLGTIHDKDFGMGICPFNPQASQRGSLY